MTTYRTVRRIDGKQLTRHQPAAATTFPSMPPRSFPVATALNQIICYGVATE